MAKDWLERILNNVQQIWEPADIQFTLLDFDRISRRDWPPTLQSHAQQYRWNDGELHSHFGYWLEGVNGFTITGSTLIFIRDYRKQIPPGSLVQRQSPLLSRVTAHEIGHPLGLHHVADPTNLMGEGEDGTDLTQQQISDARAAALQLPHSI